MVRILIDIDQDISTGFYGPGLGADYYIEISGKAQAIITSNLFVFNDNSDSTNWNGFYALLQQLHIHEEELWKHKVPLFDLGLTSDSKINILCIQMTVSAIQIFIIKF